MNPDVYSTVKAIELGEMPPTMVMPTVYQRSAEIRAESDVTSERAYLVARYEMLVGLTRQQNYCWDAVMENYVLGEHGERGLTLRNLGRCASFLVRHKLDPESLATDGIHRMKEAKECIPFDEWDSLSDERVDEVVRLAQV
jgi:hypothetical protein